jgi:3-oxoacyl-[acyl-carrier-protein] synthase-1
MGHTAILGSALCSHLGNNGQQHASALQQHPPAFLPYTNTELQETVQGFFGRIKGFASSVECLNFVIQQALASLPKNLAQDTLLKNPRTAIFSGSTSFTIGTSEALFIQDSSTPPLADIGYSGQLFALQKIWGLCGPAYSFATACTSSANAILYAHHLIQAGKIDYAIILGYEFFNHTTALGFSGLNLISKKIMRPFEADRDGLMLGEACTALILGKDDNHPVTLAGGATLGDTHSLTAANPDGSSICEVMQKALLNAQLSARDIQMVKSHGTASLMNDEAEAAGIVQLFAHNIPAIFALKPYIGHTLGACGAAEIALLIACFNAGFSPANPNFSGSDLGIQLTTQIQPLKQETQLLLNYFGFGGNNTSLVMRVKNQQV